MSANFDKAVSIVQNLPKDGPVQPSQEDKLYFYGHYKQGTVGDVNTTRPGVFDFVGKAKWDAWKALEGKSQDDAKAAYVARLIEILKGQSDDDSKKYLAELQA
ncbi:acyl-CoA-binding protein (ACBP)/diazepam binding inhibitor (DBI)/endozepine (EP) [Vanrija albida]|uniref:Acyl-CoA-binding protein (ACBP)/diazepam binding inhibitor (DBI)/endozepine (EP) n=1 Tax=Vanrija albida TaxID=181172 RepID=A0ABR3PYS8_9TREE